MQLASCLAAAVGYAVLYAAAPDRATLRRRERRTTAALLTIGALILLAAAVLAALAFGPVLGPIVVGSAALASGSVLIVVWPWLSARAGDAA